MVRSEVALLGTSEAYAQKVKGVALQRRWARGLVEGRQAGLGGLDAVLGDGFEIVQQ